MDKNHWDKVYGQKNENETSWFQPVPIKSLELIKELKLSAADPVIDIGGGESHLIENLLQSGMKDVSVLDISSVSLEKLRQRLEAKGLKAKELITSDVTQFNPTRQYKLWHDRATFHFLTKIEDVEKYLEIANVALADDGFLIVSTFAPTGPEKCSGLPITRYSEIDLKSVFGKYFSNIRCFEDTHTTPWGSTQDFIYCGFRKN